jgi:hypothetical protein
VYFLKNQFAALLFEGWSGLYQFRMKTLYSFFIGNPTVMASASNATPGDYFLSYLKTLYNFINGWVYTILIKHKNPYVKDQAILIVVFCQNKS